MNSPKQPFTILGFTPLEWLYLGIAAGIVLNEQVLKQTFTLTELAAVMFFIGLLAASVADRDGTKGPVQIIAAITELIRAVRGQGPGDTKP